jgi:hypothetical protein
MIAPSVDVRRNNRRLAARASIEPAKISYATEKPRKLHANPPGDASPKYWVRRSGFIASNWFGKILSKP